MENVSLQIDATRCVHCGKCAWVCPSEILQQEVKGGEEKTLSHKERKVEDRRCSHCVNKITETLSSIDGVYHVHVDLETKLAGFDLTKDVPDSKLLEAVKEAGYTPEMIQK